MSFALNNSQSTKLYLLPTLSDALVAITSYSLTIIEAPIGYGKTTAVKELLSYLKAPSLWYTVINESPTIFWHNFSHLFSCLNTQLANNLFSLELLDNELKLERALIYLDDLTIEKPLFLVIDDYHLLNNQYLDYFFELLTKKNIPNLHLIIISRHHFGKRSKELALKNLCYIIDKKYFTFTTSDIKTYYKNNGIKLDNKESDFLYAYTEGWISALYLQLLQFKKEHRFADSNVIFELMEEIAFIPCTKNQQQFLITLSILENFTLAQAEFILYNTKQSTENILDLLTDLMQKNNFVNENYMESIYQVHNLFNIYLRKQFDKLPSSQQHTIFTVCGDWFLQKNDIISALNFYFKAHNFEKIMQVIEKDKQASLDYQHKEQLLKYFDECPQLIKLRHPLALISHGRRLLSFGNRELFAQTVEDITSCIELATDSNVRDSLQGELELLLSFTKYNSIKAMSAHHQKACLLMQGKPSRTISAKGSYTFGCNSILFMYYRTPGTLSAEVENLAISMPFYNQLVPTSGAGSAKVMEAEALYFRGSWDESYILTTQALNIALRSKQHLVIICAYNLLMKISVARGKKDTYCDFLKQMKEIVSTSANFLQLHSALITEAWFELLLKKENPILPDWLKTGNFNATSLLLPARGCIYVVYGRYLLLKNDPLFFLGTISKFKEITTMIPSNYLNIYTQIYISAAYQKLQQHNEAEASFKIAFNLAKQDQFWLPFAENFDLLGDLINTSLPASDLPAAQKMQEIVYIYHNNLNTFNANKQLDVLTKREKEILTLLPQNLSNKEIAKELFISEITVKKALSQIYTKLGLKGRLAVIKYLNYH